MRKLTTTILLLFVCFGCKIRESKASSTYRAKSITVNSTGRIADDATTLIIPIGGDKNDGQTKGVASFNADDFNCDSGIVIDYDDYAKDTPVTGYLSSEDFKKFVSKQKAYTDNITINSTGHVAIAFNREYDTQKVIMLVCDTSKGQMYIYQKFAHVIYGYIVKEAYLDTDKKPLSKSIIVWQTKELK